MLCQMQSFHCDNEKMYCGIPNGLPEKSREEGICLPLHDLLVVEHLFPARATALPQY